MWTARRIFKELADADQRRTILTSFWKHGENHAKLMAQMQLAKALHFRDETIRKMPPEKKADLLASRAGSPEFDQFFEMALVQYHTRDRAEMLAAFLDRWNVPHENGSIESDDYTPPTTDQVREAAKELSTTYDPRDIRIYLATAGLLMGDPWRDAAWPVVDELG
ncbi:MAG TPA: hypothetical protein VF824_04330 [Thermoanaerobaculia bacterium]|jgi:hypothetical protein